jgi:hypothetical protein
MNVIEGKMYIAGSYYPAIEIVDGILATWGAGEEGWRWYTNDGYDLIQWKEVEIGKEKWPVVDCRDMIDGPGNPLWLYEKKIDAGVKKIEKFGKVLVCCLAGISRINSIASGILMKWKKMEYMDAIAEVQDKVPYAMMEQAHLNALKKLFPPSIPFSDVKPHKMKHNK